MTNSYRPLPMLLVCTTTIQGTLSVSILHNKLFPSSGTKAGLFRWAAIAPYINSVLILLHVLYFAKIDLFWKIGILLQFLGFVGVFRSSNGSYHSVVCVCVWYGRCPLSNLSQLSPMICTGDRAGGALPYMGCIGMCRCEGYGFQAVFSRIGYIIQSVWV